MPRTKVYVAGPYTHGDTKLNVDKAIDAGEELAQLGYCPYIPHLNHLWGERHSHTYDFWIQFDAEWLKECDAMLWLPGHSPGATKEAGLMMEWGRPVFRSIEALESHLPPSADDMYDGVFDLEAARATV